MGEVKELEEHLRLIEGERIEDGSLAGCTYRELVVHLMMGAICFKGNFQLLICVFKRSDSIFGDSISGVFKLEIFV